MKESFDDHNYLTEALNNGNRKAFKHLYTKYYSELCTYANSLTLDHSQAEDILQNVMVNLWNRRGSLTINTSVKSYLYRAVYNNFINTYRKKQKELNYLDEIKFKALNYFAEESSEVIDKKIRIVKKEIDTLPVKCREAFLLNKVNGLKYREVAEELGVTVKTVEAHVHKALVRIKASLEENKHLIHFILFSGKKIKRLFCS